MIRAILLFLALDGGSWPGRELVLELRVKERVAPGADPLVELALVNRSKDRTIRVVKPGDGSEVGWREPYVFWSAEVEGADGTWTPLPPRMGGRCGLYAWDWEKDAVDLKPGEKLVLKDWLRPPAGVFGFKDAQRIRLVAHYQYRALRKGKGAEEKGEKRPLEDGPMKGVAPFELRSAPAVFTVGN